MVEAVRFARSERLLTAVRGGAHSVAGHATCDDGMVIDLSPMRTVMVDPVARRAYVEGGALWVDVDAKAQEHGLGVPGGLISSTGVGGLTLGGGIGWLSRKHGLTCDNLVACELVTADGAIVRASADENPELLWALRGGGGNFGVVTSFEFELYPVGEVVAGAIMHPLEGAREFLRAWRELTPTMPDELSTILGLTTVPPSPDFPRDLHGRHVLMVGVCFAGPAEEADAALAPLRAIGSPLLERIAPMPYTARQQLQDASAPHGLMNYWKSDYLKDLDDDLIDLIVERAGAADVAAHAAAPLPARRRRGARAGGHRGLHAPLGPVPVLDRRAVGRPGRRSRAAYGVGARLLAAAAAARRRRLRELPRRRGSRPASAPRTAPPATTASPRSRRSTTRRTSSASTRTSSPRTSPHLPPPDRSTTMTSVLADAVRPRAATAELSYAHGPSDVPLLGQTIGANLRRTVERFGDREALVVRHQGYRANYNELWRQVDLAARAFVARGVAKGDRVGIWAPNRYEWVVTQFATARIGAILVTINPAYQAAEAEYALDKAGVSVLVMARGFKGSDYVAILDSIRPRLSALRSTVVLEDDWAGFLASGLAGRRGGRHRARGDPASSTTRSTSSSPRGRRGRRRARRCRTTTSSTTRT